MVTSDTSVIKMHLALIIAFFAIISYSHVHAVTGGRSSLTHFDSYPDPNSEECIRYNGCKWAGQFAFVNGKKSLDWVKSHNIVAVHERDAKRLRLKTLRIKQGGRTIDAIVYDMCSDSDCDGCCTQNAAKYGFLIDMERYTYDRFGGRDGLVEWTCLDC